METESKENTAHVPWMARLPGIGPVFRRINQSAKKRELVILLRPVVVDHGEWRRAMRASAARFCKLDRGFHYGEKTHVFGSMGEA